MNIYTNVKFKALTLILLAGLFTFSCEDDDDVSASELTPEVAISGNNLNTRRIDDDNSVLEIIEGQDLSVDMAIFSGRGLDSETAISYEFSGALTNTGSVSIPAGEVRGNLTLTIPEDEIVNGERTVTLTISSQNVPVSESRTSSLTFNIVDDLKQFSIGSAMVDTVEVFETAGMISIPIDISIDSIDVFPEISYEVDMSSTATIDDDFKLLTATTFIARDTLDKEMPYDSVVVTDESLNIVFEILDNLDQESDRFLKLNLSSVTGSDEVGLTPGVSNSVVYKIVDDTKTMSIRRLDPNVPVNNDTLTISSAGNYDLEFFVEGGKVTGNATVEVAASSMPTGVAFPSGQSITFVRDQETANFAIAVAGDAIPDMGSTFMTLTLENLDTNNMDSEIGLDPGGEISVVVELTK